MLLKLPLRIDREELLRLHAEEEDDVVARLLAGSIVPP